MSVSFAASGAVDKTVLSYFRTPRRLRIKTGRWSVGEAAALYLRHAFINASEYPSAGEQRPPLVLVRKRARVRIYDSVLDGAYSVRGLIVDHAAFVELHTAILSFAWQAKGTAADYL